MRSFKSRALGGAVVATAAAAGALALAGTAGAAEASAASSSAYVAQGSLLGVQIADVFPVAANEDSASAEAGIDDTIIGDILHLTAVHSEANVDLPTGTADASATIAGATIQLPDVLLGTNLRVEITAVEANCSIAEDGTVTAGNSEPVINLIASLPVVGDLPAINIPMVNGVATLGYEGLNLGQVTLGGVDQDISDGTISSEGVNVSLLNVGGFQGAEVSLAYAECGPVTLVEDIPVVNAEMGIGAGVAGLIAFGGYQLVMMARRQDA